MVTSSWFLPNPEPVAAIRLSSVKYGDSGGVNRDELGEKGGRLGVLRSVKLGFRAGGVSVYLTACGSVGTGMWPLHIRVASKSVKSH